MNRTDTQNNPQGAKRKYRVVQWATGNVGTRSLRGVIQHPNMELVGLYVSSPKKAGLDAARLAEKDVGFKGSIPDTGVLSTNSVDEIVALDADCVLYMRAGCDYDEICRLLASGKNIVTTRGEFHHPRTMDAAVRQRIEDACAAGNSSIYSTGSSPGFITEAMILPMLSLQRRLDCLTIDEYADMTSRDSPDMIFNVMGYGVAPGAFDQAKVDYVKHDFAGSLAQIADAIGLTIDRFDALGEMSAARNTKQIAAGTIEKGTVGALRITVTGIRNDKPVLRFRANWYCTSDIEDEGWDLRQSGWRVRLEGDTPLDLSISFPCTAEEYPGVTPGFTAHRALNSVPAVCAAVPGIRTTVDLPQVIATF